MFPRILERDTQIMDWKDRLSGWPTNSVAVSLDVYQARSDGVLYKEFATLDVANAAGPLADNCETVCVHMSQPETLDEYTPYAISAVAMSEDPLIRPFLFIGISPASITSDGGGDILAKCRIIGVADLVDDSGACMSKELTIVVAKMPAGLTTRALAIGVGMMAGTVNSANVHCWARLSVRRLVGNSPPIIDTRKL